MWFILTDFLYWFLTWIFRLMLYNINLQSKCAFNFVLIWSHGYSINIKWILKTFLSRIKNMKYHKEGSIVFAINHLKIFDSCAACWVFWSNEIFSTIFFIFKNNEQIRIQPVQLSWYRILQQGRLTNALFHFRKWNIFFS